MLPGWKRRVRTRAAVRVPMTISRCWLQWAMSALQACLLWAAPIQSRGWALWSGQRWSTLMRRPLRTNFRVRMPPPGGSNKLGCHGVRGKG